MYVSMYTMCLSKKRKSRYKVKRSVTASHSLNLQLHEVNDDLFYFPDLKPRYD